MKQAMMALSLVVCLGVAASRVTAAPEVEPVEKVVASVVKIGLDIGSRTAEAVLIERQLHQHPKPPHHHPKPHPIPKDEGGPIPLDAKGVKKYTVKLDTGDSFDNALYVGLVEASRSHASVFLTISEDGQISRIDIPGGGCGCGCGNGCPGGHCPGGGCPGGGCPGGGVFPGPGGGIPGGPATIPGEPITDN